MPRESDTGLFGGNSNWRGPVWMPLNYLLIEALKRHHHFYGDSFAWNVRLAPANDSPFSRLPKSSNAALPDSSCPMLNGRRPCLGRSDIYGTNPSATAEVAHVVP